MATNKFVRGDTKIAAKVRNIKTVLAVAVLQEELGQLLLRRTLDRFDREVDPDNKPWVPLAESTLQRRRRDAAGKGSKILHKTLALRNSIQRIRGSASGLVAANTGAGFRIGVNDPSQTGKAAAHQYGTASIPVRKFLGIGKLDVRSVDNFLRRRSIDAMR